MTEATRALLVGVLLLTAGVAGCMGDDEDGPTAEPQGLEETATNDTDENATDEPSEPRLVTSRAWHNGTVEGGALPTGGWYCSPAGSCENTLEFEVADGAETLLVEAAWEEDADAWFNVSGPNCESFPLFGDFCTPGEDTEGQSPLAIRMDDARTNETGTWTADIWVDETTPTQIEVTIAATVVLEGDLEAGYSALPGAGASPS